MFIDAETVFLGLFGNPVEHSLSPLMHNMTLQKMGINCIYLPFKINPGDLGDAVKALKKLNIRGVNVTIPFKEEVIKYLDVISDEVRTCGAVNLIKNENGQLVGYNTDGRGFIGALEEANVEIKGRVLLIGAGGAARSIAYELAYRGVEHIDFLDINYETALNLADFIAAAAAISTNAWFMNEEEFILLSRNANIIINCSPVGMYPDVEQSPVSSLETLDETVICDVIYNPLKTRFLLMGEEKGLKTINGLSMLVYQGALTLQILLGIEPPVDYMKEVVCHKLQK